MNNPISSLGQVFLKQNGVVSLNRSFSLSWENLVKPALNELKPPQLISCVSHYRLSSLHISHSGAVSHRTWCSGSLCGATSAAGGLEEELGTRMQLPPRKNQGTL